MLTPAQVIVFLSHDDADVRTRARDYLTSAHDPAPATADDFWAAADKLGGGDDAAPLVDRLGLVPQTSGSIKRVLDELPKADPASAESLLRALERVKLDLLREHWDAIRTTQAVPEHLRAHLQCRIDLANEPAEGAFDRMMSFAEQLRTRDVTVADELEAERLIEAVARRPDLFADRVVAALSDENVKEWAELLVTDVAGEMRLEGAVPALLEKLKRDDSELLWEVASDALVHIGNESVIRQIVERFADASIGFRISGGAVLGRIKRPESQAALLQLLDVTGEADDDARTTLAAALVDLLPDDEPTFTRLRELARDGRYNRRDVHLDEELLSLATLTGQSLPEADEWRTRIASDRERWAMGMSNVEQLIDRPGAMSNVDQLIQSPAAMGRSMLHVPPLAPRGVRRGTRGGTAVAERPEGQARRQPYRNAKPKVGRNDPCPCGSGKKFKKCCGK